jgi:hypothetical protein
LVATRSSFSKGALQNDICRFESSMPSHAVRSPLCDFRVWENRRHSRGLGRRAPVSGRQILGFQGEEWWICGASLCSPFSNFRFGTPETGSIYDGDKLIDADAIGRMKLSAYLLNAARGRVVDEPALVDALHRAIYKGRASKIKIHAHKIFHASIMPAPFNTRIRRMAGDGCIAAHRSLSNT